MKRLLFIFLVICPFILLVKKRKRKDDKDSLFLVTAQSRDGQKIHIGYGSGANKNFEFISFSLVDS